MLRDVGRVLQMPYGQVDKLCKLVPQNPANPITLERAIDDEPRLQAERDRDPVVRRAFDIAQKLEGLHRHASTHAAGIVIGDRPLTELVPLYRDPKSLDAGDPVQHEMGRAGGTGEVRFSRPQDADRARSRGQAGAPARHRHRSVANLPLDDAKTYEMLARGETVGVFQVESQGMRRALVDMRPDRFEDLIVLVALYRPGPMANIPTYCARKLGHERTDYLHPKLEPILRETYGIITYQEQVHADRAAISPATRSAKPTSCAAPWARRSARRWRRSATVSSPARSSAASSRPTPKRSSNACAQVCRLRLQQIALGALCAAHLSDRLYEGELSRSSSWPRR